jgi:hypothetical protein
MDGMTTPHHQDHEITKNGFSFVVFVSLVVNRRAVNYLDKIRNTRYVFPLMESLSRSPKDGWEDGKLWLFEMLVHNLSREPERGGDFLTNIARNPLKRLDSKK